MYSTGDGCSAYGNRNFWRTWSDWFGLPISGVAPLPVSDVWLSAREATVGQPITAAFTIRNIMGKDILLPSVGFNTTMGGKQYDFGIQTNITIPANQSREIVGVFTPTVSGSYSIQGVYQFLQGWYGSGTRSTTTVEWPAVTMGTPLSISPEFPLASETTTVQFTIKNTGRLTAYLKYVMAANLDGTTPAGYAASTVSIAPGQSYTYSATRVLGQSRQQTAWIAFQIGDSWFRLGDNKLYRGFNSPANLQLTSSVKTSPEAPVINSPTTASFKIKNSGDQPVRVANIGLGVIRRSDGARFDYTSQTNGIPGVINGGEEWTYSASRSFPTKDAYDVFLTSSYDGVNFSGDFISAAANVSKTLNVQTYLSPAKLELLTPLSARQTGGPLSHIIDLSYMVKNTGDAPTGPVNIAFYCRQNLTGYCDIPGRTISLNAGETASLNSALGYFSAGTYTFRPLKYQDGLWQDFGNTVSSTVQSTPPKSTDFTASMNFSKLTAVVGEPVTVTYTIKNNSSADLQVPIYAVAARLNGAFYDFGLQNWFFLRSGETKTFSAIFTAQTPGTYNLFPVLKTANNSWYGYGESLLVVQ
jgi:archaellum component FlaG (FlaF/FlaG flagellin family)